MNKRLYNNLNSNSEIHLSSVVIIGRKFPEAERKGIVNVLTSESESDSTVDAAWEAAENTVMGGIAEGPATGAGAGAEIGIGFGVTTGGFPI